MSPHTWVLLFFASIVFLGGFVAGVAACAWDQRELPEDTTEPDRPIPVRTFYDQEREGA
jgi:hypothetical protein